MKKFISIYLALTFSFLTLPLQSNAKINTKKIDSLLNDLFDKNGAGGIALVVKDGKTVYRKAFGMANLEFDIKMTPENVFQIGSITKQFTAMAIMKLVEQKKINLDDEITQFIKDYPTHDHKITIEHLLTHTSGIKSYTSIKNWISAKRRLDSTPEEVIDYFKNEPMDFKPGEKQKYSNSGYYLLGYIIEKISGQPYGEFIEKNLLQPLKMSDSSYGSVAKIIKNKVSGYAKSGDTYINAEYWSISQAYAAGGLFSTVDDLYKWYAAVTSNQVVSEASFNQAISPTILNNGEQATYGFGWQLGNIKGSPMISHGGNMDGYATWSNFLLDENVFVAVFSNCMCNYPYEVSNKITAIAIDKPFEWKEISLDEELLNSYDGIYSSKEFGERVLSYTNGILKFYMPEGRKFTLHPFSKDKFFFDKQPHLFNTLNVIRGANGKISSIKMLSISADKTWAKTNKNIPKYHAIEISTEALKKYVGKYELFPHFFLNIVLENNNLFIVETGRSKGKLTAYAEHKFDSGFLDTQFTFNFDDSNNVISFTLHRGGDTEAKKVD